MALIDTLEGTLDDRLWFHYDVGSDVLYIRLRAHRDTPTLAEETDAGLVLLRAETTDQPVGLTAVNFWKRFGHGPLPDSFREIHSRIEPLASQLAV